jgi:FixJ family two-component response regulator
LELQELPFGRRSETAMSPQSVFVIDDDLVTRDTVVHLARARGWPPRSFSTAEEFLADYESSASGCIVAELKLAGISGLGLLAELKSRDIPLPVVFLTAHADVPTAVKAMQNGAHTLLQKPCAEGVLIQAIEAALKQERERRGVWVARHRIRTRLATLAEGELAVMRELIAGKPNKSIATELGIGLRTVELRRARLLKKMQAGSLAELVRMATLVDVLRAVEGENP